MEANYWYFGDSAGVNFNSAKPVALTNGKLNTGEGSATISTRSRRLLFYTDGIKVWDSTHSVMPNGNGLKGNYSTTQSAIIIQKPGSSNIFYIFTISVGDNDTLFFSELNMQLHSGKGDIVSGKKNIPILTPTCEKITAVKHANRQDYWLLVHKYESDSIYSFLITSGGLDQNPVKSATGLIIKGNKAFTLGYMKISPNGKKLGYVNWKMDSSVIADFNTTTGKVSNVWVFQNTYAYGIEFSPRSKYLYISELYPKNLFQYDLNATSKANFKSSKILVDSGYSNSPGAIQLGLDGKIYIACDNDLNLHVINYPDSIGRKCHPLKNFLYLGGTHLGGRKSKLGLPNFPSNYFLNKSFNVYRNCLNDTTFFTFIDTFYPRDSVKWNFGDSMAGISNSSDRITNIFHIYKKQGLYTARVVYFYKHFIDTVIKTIYIKDPKPKLGEDTNYCNSFGRLLKPHKDYINYKWSIGSKQNSIMVFDKGIYILNAQDTVGCWSSDTIEINNSSSIADFSINDTSQCFKYNSFLLKETTLYKGDTRKKATWPFEDGSSLSDSLVKKTFSTPGNHSIKLVVESKTGCVDSITKPVLVFPGTSIGFTIDKPVQCYIGNRFNFTNTSKSVDSISFQWDIEQNINNSKNILNKSFSKEGIYNVSLITSTASYCRDTMIKTITIFPNPVSVFSIPNPTQCLNTNSFNFNNTSSIKTGNINTWKWNLGDGNTSVLKNITSKKYVIVDSFKIALLAISDKGCRDSISKTIVVKSQSKADFTVDDICENDTAIFVNTSKNGVNYNWRFGDGENSTLHSPKHVYEIDGGSQTFNATLVAIVPGGCSDSTSRPITVNANPLSDFNFNPIDKQVNFAAIAGGSNYYWEFGDGGKLNTTNTLYSHTYTTLTTFHVCLTVTNAAGCKSQTCKDVLVTGGINPLSKLSGIQIFPNPSSGRFTLTIANPKADISIAVYRITGELIKTIETDPVKTSYSVDLNVATGEYIVKIINGREVYSQKVTVDKH